MYFKNQKAYGHTKSAECPFCGKQATTKSTQGLPVCRQHIEEELLDMKCICGEYLDLKFSKHGPFFVCMKCGCVNFKKGLEYNNKLPENSYNPSSGTINRPHRSVKKSTGSDTDSINQEFRKKFNKSFSFEDHFE